MASKVRYSYGSLLDSDDEGIDQSNSEDESSIFAVAKRFSAIDLVGGVASQGTKMCIVRAFSPPVSASMG